MDFLIRARLMKDPVILLENTPEVAVRQARWILSLARNVPQTRLWSVNRARG